jgi:hypothetical protein
MNPIGEKRGQTGKIVRAFIRLQEPSDLARQVFGRPSAAPLTLR